jgi:hypothetical protein
MRVQIARRFTIPPCCERSLGVFCFSSGLGSPFLLLLLVVETAWASRSSAS